MARTPSTAATERGAATRQRLIAATAELIEAGGYRATGLLQVVARSGAPRGSLYFHFPGGKEELAAQAVAASAGALSQLIARELESDAPTAVAVAGLIDALADRLEGSGWSHGCPVATVALEVSADEPTLGAACRDAYVDWQALLAERLVRDGLDEALARDRAELILASIEGALLLAKVHRDRGPLRRLAGTLPLLLTPHP